MISVITGASGFIGSHLARRLLKEKDDVYAIVKPDANLWRLEGSIEDLNIGYIDLLDKESLSTFLKKTDPDRIFHLAAYGVYPTQREISLLFKNNITATINLIDAVSGSDYKSLVFMGSGFEYGSKSKPFKETDELNPPDIYSFSKAALSSNIQLFSKMSSLPINIARLFLVYGKLEASTRLIPTLIKAYRNNESPQLYSKDNVRDFIYVDDVIDALLSISQSGCCGEIFNIGSGKEHTVEELANIVKGLFNSDIEPTWGVAAERPFEPRHWCADISKAKRMLEWEPVIDIIEGLRKTIKDSS